jgi:hypothetical protein
MKKKSKLATTTWKRAGLAATAMALVFAMGCSNIEQVIQEAEEGEVTITTGEGKDVTLSSKADIPEGFPSDVPLPDEIEVTSSISASDSITVTIETEMPYDEAVALYVDYTQQAGYSEVSRMGDDNSIHYSSQKGTERFIFTLQRDLEDNKTVTGALVYSNHPETEQ